MKSIFLAVLLTVAALAPVSAQTDDRRRPPPVGHLDEIVRAVDWEAVRADIKRRADARAATGAAETMVLVAYQAEAAARTRLPVLLPALPEALGTLAEAGERGVLRLVPRENFYVASFALPDATVEVFGTRTARTVTGRNGELPAGLFRQDGEGFRLRETETGLELSFERFNCAYKISLICNRPTTDADCRAETRMRDFARTMSVVGGAEGGHD